jgi:hypothetical protein
MHVSASRLSGPRAAHRVAVFGGMCGRLYMIFFVLRLNNLFYSKLFLNLFFQLLFSIIS